MDDPALSLVGAGPLTPELALRLPADEVMRLMVDRATIRPVDVGDVVEVIRGASSRVGDVVVCARNGACELGRLVRATGPRLQVEVGPRGERVPIAPDAILGVVTALEQGDLLLDL